VSAVPSLCELYPGICLTTEEKSMEKPQSLTLPREILRYLTDRRMGGPHSRSLPEFESRIVQPVAICYTTYTTAAPLLLARTLGLQFTEKLCILLHFTENSGNRL
jgi:hypothetical protein